MIPHGDVVVTGIAPHESRSERKFVESDPLESQAVADEFVLEASTPSLAYESASNLRIADLGRVLQVVLVYDRLLRD
jgi:hypothetical protein